MQESEGAGNSEQIKNLSKENARMKKRIMELEGKITKIQANEENIQSLQEKETTLRNIVENSTNLFYFHDIDHILTYLSPQVKDILEYEPKEALKKWTELASDNPVNLKGVEATERAIRTGKRQPPYELELVTKTGKKVWLEIHEAPVIEDGVVTGIVGAATDITTQKHAEETIKRSEEKYARIVQAIPDLFFRISGEYKFLSYAGNVEDLYVAPEFFLGKFISNVFPPPLANRMEKTIDATLKTREPQILEYKLEIDNEERSFEARLLFYEENEVAVFIRDISERKRAEMNLKQSEEKFSKAFHLSPVIYAISTLQEGRYIEVNDAFCSRLGYSREEAIGNTIVDLKLVSREDLRILNTALASGDPVRNIEIMVHPKNGEPFSGLFSAEVFDFQGEKYLMGSVNDVSEKKKLEDERLRSQKLESLALLAGGIAHDFNNILVGILGNVNLIQISEGERIDHEILESLTDVEKATLRAKELTRQLLTFSKGGSPVKKPVSINQIIQDSVSLVMRGRSANCELDLALDLPNIAADAGQISQIINNLLINAVQAMSHGGTVKVTSGKTRLGKHSNTGLPAGNYIKIIVEDEGTGIPYDIQKHIFEPYFTTKTEGSGLGLATSYSIIKRHGGYMDFHSTPGKGTSFFFYLPIISEAIARGTPVNERKERFSGKILLMDDDITVRTVLGKILGRLGFSVEFVNEGKKAIELFREAFESGEKFTLVIMDLTIPGGMGGKDAIKHIHGIDPNVVAIVSSGYSNDPIMAHYQDYGFRGVLRKPYTIEDLRNLLSKIL